MFYWCNAVNLFWSMSLYEMLFQLERRRFVCSVARRTRSVNSCSVPPVDTTIMVAASTPQSPSHLRYGQAGSVLTVRCARCAGKKCFNTTLRNCIEKACLTPIFMQNLISIYWYWYYRQPGEDSKMLVCDTCDKGYHTFCLKPVMTAIPKNGWKCKVIGSYSDLIVFHLPFNLLLVFCKGLRKQEK